MDALIFPDIGLKTLGSNATGASFSFPKIVAGDDIRLKLRLIETLAGDKVLSRRTISAMKLSVGKQDARPTSGSFQLKLGSGSESAGVNTTANLAFDISAADLATALNALTDAALSAKKPFTVVKRDDAWHIRAADSGTVTWVVVDNALLPQSLVSIRDYSFDEGTSYELRLTQTVLCEQTAFDSIVPELASVSVVQAGAEESGVKRNTIQQIYFPPELSDVYSFRLRWGLRRTAAIGSPADAEAIQAALEAIAVTGETVTVTDGDDRVLIEFSGDSLAGTSVAALVIEHLVTPDADNVIAMTTETDGMAKYMATIANAASGITEFKLPLSLKIWLVDEQDEEDTDPITFLQELTFQKPVALDAFSAAAVLNPTRPLSNRSYLPFSPSQVTETQRGYLLTGGTALGNGTATEFQVDHNLGTRHVYVALFGSAVDGQMLKHGTDYEVEIVSDNAVLITFATAPASGGVVGGICTVASTNAFVDLEINIGQVIGLEARLVAAEETIAQLQGTAAAGSLGTKDTAIGEAVVEIDLGTFGEVYPARKTLDELMSSQGSKLANANVTQVTTGTTTTTTTTGTPQEPAAKRIADIPLGILPKDSALLPAVHDATVDDLPDPIPTPGSGNKGKVYVNAGSVDITLPGGGGRKGVVLKPGEHCASDGRLLYKVRRSGTTTSYFPTDFEREFALVAINNDMLAVKRTLEFRLGLELAIVNKKVPVPGISDKQTRAQWKLKIEWGTRTSETSPSTPASNLKGIAWNSTPILATTLDITTSPTIHTVGARIKRTAADAWTVEKSLYGLWTSSAATINAGSFFLRARFEEFDVEDIADPRGFVILLGTHVATGEDSDSIGVLTIK